MGAAAFRKVSVLKGSATNPRVTRSLRANPRRGYWGLLRRSQAGPSVVVREPSSLHLSLHPSGPEGLVLVEKA